MAERFLRLPEVCERTGLRRSTVYRRMKAGQFPSPIPLGNPHIVGWLESEITAYITAQVEAARGESLRAA